MLKRIKIILVVTLFMPIVSFPQETLRQEVKSNELSVLLLMGEWFGDAYFPLKTEIESRGWKMKRVGVDAEYRGCYNKERDVLLTSDILIPDIADFSDYDCLIIPSGPQFRFFVENPVVLQFIRDAHSSGLLIVSFCTGNNVVKAAGLIDIEYGQLFPPNIISAGDRILIGPRGGGPPPGNGFEGVPYKAICDSITCNITRSRENSIMRK